MPVIFMAIIKSNPVYIINLHLFFPVVVKHLSESKSECSIWLDEGAPRSASDMDN